MVRQDSLFDPIEEKTNDQERQKATNEERQTAIDAIHERLNLLKRNQSHEEYTILEELFAANEDFKNECIAIAKENRLSTYKSSKSFADNRADNVLFRAFMLSYVKKIHPEHFVEVIATYTPAIEELSDQLLRL